MKPTVCEYCGATYHQPYEDGLVECRNNLRDQRDDARDLADAMINQEREACARIADRNDQSAWGIASEIRMRRATPPIGTAKP